MISNFGFPPSQSVCLFRPDITMMMISSKILLLLVWCLVIMVLVDSSGYFVEGFPNRQSGYSGSEPLFLTPLIESNQIEKARMLSEVRLNGTNLKSYSGFLTVDKHYDSNLFFWFWPAMSNKTDCPIMLWLEGGPGGSSLIALLIENGPVMLDKQGQLSINNYTWNEDYAMIYIDNPVGVGFSFTKNPKGFAENEVQVAENLYTALEQFFTLFPELQKNPFYISGESYGGKYVPAIAYKIHKVGNKAKIPINLQGLIIGDGWCDPLIQMNYGEFLFQVGLLDEIQRSHFTEEQNKMAALVKQRRFKEAEAIMMELIEGGALTDPTYFHNVTGFDYYHNFLELNPPTKYPNCSKFLDLPETRKSIHVGNLKYLEQSEEVFYHLMGDTMDTVKPWVEEILNAGYRILFYQGQLDIIVATPLFEDFLRQLHWKGEDKYRSSTRIIYRVDPKDEHVAGYVRHADNLYYAMVRVAGHGVILDQPRVAKDLVQRFVRNQPFDQ